MNNVINMTPMTTENNSTLSAFLVTKSRAFELYNMEKFNAQNFVDFIHNTG